MAYKEILLSGDGIRFEMVEAGSTLVIRAFAELNEKRSFMDPIIPKGYTYVGGEWNNGFTIRDSKGNLWVWVPVESLPEDGFFDGRRSKFGRRNFHESEDGFTNDCFSKEEFHEEVSEELVKQKESVLKYGGYYVSKYIISVNKKGKPRSIQGVMPRNNINLNDAKELASKLGENGVTESHLIFGSEYDSLCKWLICSGAKTYEEVVRDSTSWGNYWNSKKSTHDVTKTGAKKEYYVNGIADLAGNLWTWTQERYGDSRFCVRGGSFCNYGGVFKPVVCRDYNSPSNFSNFIGLRAALYIK